MKIVLHSAPKDFFKSNPPYTSNELFSLIRKADLLGFKCFQIGPLSDFVDIDGKCLRSLFDHYNMESNVHVGGLYSAEKLAVTKEEYSKVQKEIHHGIELCRKITSKLVSFHPPFFTRKAPENKTFLSGFLCRV